LYSAWISVGAHLHRFLAQLGVPILDRRRLREHGCPAELRVDPTELLVLPIRVAGEDLNLICAHQSSAAVRRM
jgi:hypothetical protein